MASGYPIWARGEVMALVAIGCCGAYCATCQALRAGACKGCKIGYGDGGREIGKARCMMKRCCLAKGLQSCADCAEFTSCEILKKFFQKGGYKYGKYRQALEYIRDHGYERFLEIADQWTGAYGKYD